MEVTHKMKPFVYPLQDDIVKLQNYEGGEREVESAKPEAWPGNSCSESSY